MSSVKLPLPINLKMQGGTCISSKTKRKKFQSLRCSERALEAGFSSLIHTPLVAKSSTSIGNEKSNATHWLASFRVEKQSGACSLIVSCVARDSDDNISNECISKDGLPTATRNGGLLKIAGIIGVSTTVSKILGLVREMALAAAFGVGPVTTAFNYASILPSFFMSLLGGLNGPLHTTATTALSKRSKEDGKQLIEKTTTIVFLVTAALGGAVFIFADSIIGVTAPGLLATGVKHGELTKDLAIIQLKIMSPCIMFAGPIGIGFGCLSAVGIYAVPSLSPALSSVAILLGVGVYCLRLGTSTCAQACLAGSVIIACAASIGALAQWLMQGIAQQEAGFSVLSVCWTNPFKDTDIHELFAVMVPAMVGSGMLQIATFTDLYFASFISGAAASLSYANLLAMAPLGVLSSSILLPLLPIFSRLATPTLWPRLKEHLKQGVLLCMVVTLPVIANVLVLAKPIVRVLFQRFAFDASATTLVSSLLICYVLGSPFYLIRDLLVRVFYALEDAQPPFQISVAAVLMNAFLDWILILKMRLGAEGLVIATSLVNALSMIALLLLMSKKLGGLALIDWVRPCLLLIAYCIFSMVMVTFVYVRLHLLLPCISSIRSIWISELLLIVLASSMGVLAFIFPLVWFRLPELEPVKKFILTS